MMEKLVRFKAETHEIGMFIKYMDYPRQIKMIYFEDGYKSIYVIEDSNKIQRNV